LGSKLIGKDVLEKKLYDQLYKDTVKALELIAGAMSAVKV
jgi:2-dehydro-3-deoxyphosphogluconate aldolase/(4S)-4-hydroxy-2-oxoglutarate aldolase